MTLTGQRAVVPDNKLQALSGVVVQLLTYCKANDWAGYDPYDALNSRVFLAWPALDSKWPRIVLTQLLKRSPINLRPLLRIPKTQNPKGLALSLTALIKLRQLGLVDDSASIDYLVSRIEAKRSSGEHWCWGYSFPWQGRSILLPEAAPNLVCTTFVADALLDLFDETYDPHYLAIARSAGDYLLGLFWNDGTSVYSFAYPTALVQSRVHNANLLAAALLLRLYRHSGEERLRRVAIDVAEYSVGRQQPDGSWFYGELASQQWIDNFHTGYNLCALRRIAEHGETTAFDQSIERGYHFYRDHFFREDGAPKYFYNRTYPLDVHSVAQSVITLTEFSDHDSSAAELARKVATWAINNLWDQRGFFSYQKLPWGTNNISYMRWGQAWMLLALATLLGSKTQCRFDVS